MTNITRDTIEFVEKAKNAFEADERLSTFRGEGLIALRTGMFDDCIRVFELGNEVGLFAQWIEISK